MRFANPHPPRRGAFLLIALFSCLQILLGFFLFTGNESESLLPKHTSIDIASHEDALLFSKIQPASGLQTKNQSVDYDYDGTFSFFDEYRKKAREKAAARQHASTKKRLQQKHLAHLETRPTGNITRHVIDDNNTSLPESSSQYER